MTTEYRIIKKGFAKVIEEERKIFSEGDKNSANVEKTMIWVKKYVMLIEYEKRRISHLIIYDSKLDVGSGKLNNIIVIDEHIEVKMTQAIDEEKFCLMIYKDLIDSVILAYDSVDERIEWKSTLNHVIKIKSALSALVPPRRVKQEILTEKHERKSHKICENVDVALSAETPPLIPPRGVKQEIAKEHEMTDNMIYEGIRLDRKQSDLASDRFAEKADMRQRDRSGHGDFVMRGSLEAPQELSHDSNSSYNNMYVVQIQENATANRLNLHGNYTLKLYDDGFQLLDKEAEHVLYSWPVTVLRRYGSSTSNSNDNFSFESGRGSQTGVGNFIFSTPYCKLINQSVYSMTQYAKPQRSTNLNRVDFLESRKLEIYDDRVPKHDIKPQLISPNRNEISSQFSGEVVKESLREKREQNERMGYSVLDRGECRYPRNLPNSKVVKEDLREKQKQNEVMGYTRNLDNSKNLKIENEIYGGVHTYTVKIVENETAERLALQGDYDLKLCDDTILLLNMETNNILFSWPVGFLRRYECSNNTFSFETGRRSETGVGRFVVSTIHCEIITQKVFEMCEHVKENKAKSDSHKSESTESHEITDREEPRDDTTAEGPNIISPKIIWKNYPPHYFDTREHTPEPDQQTPRGIQCQQDSPVPSLELRELEISNYPEWTPQCPGVHVQGFESPTNTTCNDILISSKSENLDEN